MKRREFLQSAGGGVLSAPALLAQRGANEKIGIAVIGVGTRGIYLLKEFQNVPGVEVRVICDLYDGNIKRAKEFTANTKARVTKDWKSAVSDKDVQAVIVATPDFWHASMVIGAAENKKDVYVEKGWCLNLDQAKQMRKAIKDNKVMMQLGHNYNSIDTYHKARELYQAGKIGVVPLVRMYIDRTFLEYPQWKFYTDYSIHELPKDANATTIDWERFTANTTKRPFDPERFFRWRNWWEYGNGIAGDLMSHVWDGVNGIMYCGIPERLYTQGDLYYWTKDQEVPDIWNVMMDYPAKKLAMTFSSNFHNRHQGEISTLLGRDGTIDVSPRSCRYFSAEWADAKKMNASRSGKGVEPDIDFNAGEMKVSSHWQNFIDGVKTRQRPRCHEDRAFEEAAVICMSVESHKQGRRVTWDSAKEQIV